MRTLALLPFLVLALSLTISDATSAQVPAVPEPIAVYYGWPSVVNGSRRNVQTAAAVFSAYRRVVLGDGLQNSSHGDHQRTRQIIAAASNTDFYGYIPLGQLSWNQRLSLAQIKSRIAAWNGMGVRGIFLDEAGYDYGVTRTLQNGAVDACHALSRSAWVNAWVPADVFDPKRVALNSVGGGNPTGLPTRLGASDRYLLESFQVSRGQYRPPGFFAAKADSAFAYRAQFGTRLDAVTTTTPQAGFSQSQFDYAWYSALMYGLDGLGWGEPDFSASTALLSYRRRPNVVGLGTRWLPGAVIHAPSLPVHHRLSDLGQVRLDTALHVGAFFGATTLVPATLPIGVLTSITVSAVGSGGQPYVAAAALSESPGTSLADGRVFPVTPDFLFMMSITPNNGVFRDFFGLLDNAGMARPSIFVPSIPALSGLQLFLAFAVIDAGLPGQIRTFSTAKSMTIR